MQNLIDIGLISEQKIIHYTNTLLTALNTKDLPLDCSIPEQYPCSIDRKFLNDNDLTEDYAELINCVKRHVCRPDGYCKSKVDKKCRFDFPIPICQAAHIEFI